MDLVRSTIDFFSGCCEGVAGIDRGEAPFEVISSGGDLTLWELSARPNMLPMRELIVCRFAGGALLEARESAGVPLVFGGATGPP